MVAIRQNGEDRTRQIKDWKITWDARSQKLLLTLTFHSGKSFTQAVDEFEIEPTYVKKGQLLSRNGGVTFDAIDSAVIYGERYAVIRFPSGTKPYVMRASDVLLMAQSGMKDSVTFRYFQDVARARIVSAQRADVPIAENVLRQLNSIVAREDSVLNAYILGTSQVRGNPGDLIYPFGVNQSQLDAVERAFASQISLVEGPPGTGKTQTILNIVANVLLRGKTVAILSNNNAAVSNVYEKLSKHGLDFLVAKLGSKDNQADFFGSVMALPLVGPEPEPAPDMAQIQATLASVKQYLAAQNAVARLRAEVDELTVELEHLKKWQRDNNFGAAVALSKYRLSPAKTTDLMAYLAYLAQRRVRLKDRLELLLAFRIWRTKPLETLDQRVTVIFALQNHYYETVLAQRKAELKSLEAVLVRENFDALMEELRAGSMAFLKHHLHLHIPLNDQFKTDDYKKRFEEFIRRFPVIGSSTHSIVNSLKQGAILDYVIIDEASQQDILPGVLGLGCARNLVVVGDRKQLPHIPARVGVVSPLDAFDCEKFSLLDSCVHVFGNSIPTTLLKEHYRCHPRIIQFCNQQFYNNELVPMKAADHDAPLSLVVTARGNHTRRSSKGYTNERELDSLLAILEKEGDTAGQSDDGRGFIAPYRRQVVLAESRLPADFVKDTVHKFQGRECDEMVFSTVLDKKRESQRNLSFVDDPHLVNVAVSRAKDRFTLVTGDDVFSANNGHIAALVRYIEYYANGEAINRAPVVSAFDLLYREYDKSLERLNSRLRPDDSKFKSEQIIAQILRETLDEEANRSVMFHTQIRLIQLVSISHPTLTLRERNFINNHASCDFVVYFKVGKAPVGVIEVDGGSHDRPEQAARDALKNSILRKCGIQLLRLRTVESGIEQRVAEFVGQWTRTSGYGDSGALSAQA